MAVFLTKLKLSQDFRGTFPARRPSTTCATCVGVLRHAVPDTPHARCPCTAPRSLQLSLRLFAGFHGARPSFASTRLLYSISVHLQQCVREPISSSVSGSVAYREVHQAAQDLHRDAVRRLLPTTRPRPPHDTHRPMTVTWQGGIREPHGVQGGGLLRRFRRMLRIQAGRCSQSAGHAVGGAWLERETPAESSAW